jgi:hypothetical protein
MRPRVIALEGPSGIGKTLIAARLAADLPGIVRLPEAYERLRNPPSLAVPDRARLWRVEHRLLREEQRRYREAVQRRSAGVVVLADTGFLGPLTYCIGLARLDPGRNVVAPLWTEYEHAVAAGRLGMPDLTILLEAPGPTVRDRAAADPTHHPPAWADRHARIGRFERALWTGPIGQRLGGRLRRISATGPPDRVALRLQHLLGDGRLPPALPPEAAVRRLGAVLRGIAIRNR